MEAINAVSELFSVEARGWAERGMEFSKRFQQESPEVQQLWTQQNQKLANAFQAVLSNQQESPLYQALIDSKIFEMDHFIKFAQATESIMGECNRIRAEHPQAKDAIAGMFALVTVGLQAHYLHGDCMDNLLRIVLETEKKTA